MALKSLRQRIALAICPELAATLDATRSAAAKARWLAEERAQLVEHRAQELSIERRCPPKGCA